MKSKKKQSRQSYKYEQEPWNSQLKDVITGAYERFTCYPGIEYHDIGTKLAEIYLSVELIEDSFNESGIE